LRKILIAGLFLVLPSCRETVKQAVLMPSEIKVEVQKPEYKEVSEEVYEEVIREEVSIKVVSENRINKEIAGVERDKLSVNSDINQDLWLSSLEVISDKMPIIAMEKDKGLIVTDWGKYYPNLANERCKINVSVKGGEFTDENLVVSVFKQVLKDDEWISVVTERDLAENIKSDILKNAFFVRVTK
jgi:hypothetical protein